MMAYLSPKDERAKAIIGKSMSANYFGHINPFILYQWLFIRNGYNDKSIHSNTNNDPKLSFWIILKSSEC